MAIQTPVPLVIPSECPGCKEPIPVGHYGAVNDMLLWDDQFNFGKGGYVRLIGWVSCHKYLMGTVVDTFDADCNTIWEKHPRPWSTEHVYDKTLDGRKLVDISVCQLEVQVLTREQYHAQVDAWVKANPVAL